MIEPSEVQLEVDTTLIEVGFGVEYFNECNQSVESFDRVCTIFIGETSDDPQNAKLHQR